MEASRPSLVLRATGLVKQLFLSKRLKRLSTFEPLYGLHVVGFRSLHHGFGQKVHQRVSSSPQQPYFRGITTTSRPKKVSQRCSVTGDLPGARELPPVGSTAVTRPCAPLAGEAQFRAKRSLCLAFQTSGTTGRRVGPTPALIFLTVALPGCDPG